MTIRFSEEVSGNFPFDPEEVGKEVILQALESEGFPYEAEVDLTLTNDAMIHELNEQFRKIDAATDVLSFPLIEYPSAGDFSKLEEDPDAFSPESGEAMLGDIVISVEHVHRQAEEYGHSLKREYAFLICHSMLHLMGFDHIEEEDRIRMEEEQRKIMADLNILRSEEAEA
jgi:probable rRNA maturation factor